LFKVKFQNMNRMNLLFYKAFLTSFKQNTIHSQIILDNVKTQAQTTRRNKTLSTTQTKGYKMNMKQKQLIKTINQAYVKLSTLNNINWTPYRDNLYKLNLADEKMHRRTFGGHKRTFETPMADCARLFVVQHIAQALKNPDLYKIQDILHIRESAIKAQALVNNYGKLVLEAWKDENINDLARLDYIALIDFEEFEKNQAHRLEAGTI
jgi:hypothetical protein